MKLFCVLAIGFLSYYFWIITSNNSTPHLSGISSERKIISASTFDVSKNVNKENKGINTNSCGQFIDGWNDSNSLINIRKSKLKAFFQVLYQQNVQWSYLDYLAEEAGIPLLEASQILPTERVPDNKLNIVNLYSNLSLATLEESRILKSLIKNQQLYNISNLLGEQSDKKLYSSKPLFTFILENTINYDSGLFEDLIALGLRPNTLDIIYALKLNAEHSLLKTLIENSSETKELYWKENNKALSVALLASKQFNLFALKEWFNKIQPETTQLPFFSELDFIPIPNKENEMQALRIVELLLDNERQVLTRIGFRRLASWLPKDWLFENKHRIKIPTIQLNKHDLIHLDELKSLLSDSALQIVKAKKMEMICNPGFISEITTRKEAVELLDISKKSQFFEQNLTKFKMTNHIATLIHTEMNDEVDKTRTQLINSLLYNKWSESQKIIETFLGTSFENIILDVSITTAISGNAPIEFIVYLLNNGAKIPDDAVRTVSVLGYEKLANHLINYGLDIHYVNTVGMNGLSYITQNSDDNFGINKMFSFLLENGISTQPTIYGLDPLNFALIKVPKSKVAIFYAQELIKYGAVVDDSHNQQVSKLKRSSPSAYIKLINLIPELESSN
ncbi:MAG: hypothetical protein HRT37_25875 [Alteromonadaceae bacterium]|nr:hypothetical protein [Alteromonadaceae bacterium]